MATPIDPVKEGLEKLAKAMLNAEASAKGLHVVVHRMKKVFSEQDEAMRANIEAAKKKLVVERMLIESSKDLWDAYSKRNKLLKESAKVIGEKVAAQKKEQAAEDKLDRLIAARHSGMKGYINSANECISSIKGMTSGVLSLGSALGITSFSFSDMVKTTLDYRKSLFEVSRSQTVLGRGSNDLAKSLDFVRYQTKMSQMQFLSLSSAMMKTFVGVKPGMMEIAGVLKVWGEQMGGNYDSAQTLFDMQSRFPPLFERMQKGLKSIEALNGNLSDAERQRHEASLQGIRAQISSYGMLADVSSSQIDQALQALTPLTAQEKEYKDLILERAAISQKTGDLQLQYAEKFKPVQDELIKGATRLLDVLGEFPNVTTAVVGTAAAMGGLTSVIRVAGAAMRTFGATSAAATGGITILIGGAIYGIMKYMDHVQKSSEMAKKMANEEKTNAAHQQLITSLTTKQRAEYEKLNKDSERVGESLEEQQARQKGI